MFSEEEITKLFNNLTAVGYNFKNVQMEKVGPVGTEGHLKKIDVVDKSRFVVYGSNEASTIEISEIRAAWTDEYLAEFVPQIKSGEFIEKFLKPFSNFEKFTFNR